MRAAGIGGDHRVADGLQRDVRAILLREDGLLGALALGDVGNRAFVADDAAARRRARRGNSPAPPPACRRAGAASLPSSALRRRRRRARTKSARSGGLQYSITELGNAYISSAEP